MDFGVVGFENGGLVCSGNRGFSSPEDAESKQKWYGSGFLKQQRSVTATQDDDDDWRLLKLPKTTTNNTISDDFFSPSKSMLTTATTPTSAGGGGTTTLSLRSHHFFSSDMLTNNNSQSLTFPYYSSSSSSSSSSSIAFTRNASAGYGSGGILHGSFTPSQWMELEHQALIYKYISANVPIPSYLVNPIRKAFDSAGFSTFTSLRPNSFGWGAFHLGFSNSSDPEPGRCRRTDGKKWRCSRDAITDHKYCERHMNRGRHRSRKPVEGQSGHSVSGTSNNTVKLMPVSSSASAAVVPGGGGASSNSLGLSSQQHHQLNKIHQQSRKSNATTSAPPHGNNRNLMNKECLGESYKDTTNGLSIISPAIIISMKENQYSISKQQNLYGESSRGEFGQVCSDSLVNPLNRSSSLVNCCNYGTSEDINDRESKPQRSFRQFMDDWPNSHYPDRSWPDVEMHSDRTQLSISIPKTTSDFMSSTSSPTNEKLTPSPLRLSREHDANTHMGLAVGCNADERIHRQTNWIPISWGSSMGGPLGEVLHNTNNNSTGDGKNGSPLNLMSEGWDGSPRPASSSSSSSSSPTGVLQKASLLSSLSNSSAGSSPRADNNKIHEGSSLYSFALGSSLMNTSFMNH